MIYNIQILRAIAALMVVAYHTVGTSEKYSLPTNFIYNVDNWGAAGVDIFFVISGFIMVYIQHKKQRSPFQFLADRVERIVPLYWFLTLFLATLVVVLPSAFNTREFDLSFLLSSLFFINFISDIEPLVYVGWTLEYEMLFYLVFGLSLLVKEEKTSLLLTAVVLSVIVLLGVNSIVFEFIYGMLLGYIFNKIKHVQKKSIYSIGIFLGFALLVVSSNFDLLRNLKWGLPAVLIFLGFLFIKPIENKILRKLGDASYSIYLIQVFTIPVFYKIVSKLPTQFPFAAELYVIMCMLATSIVGLILYWAFEKPIIYIIRRIKSSNQSKVKNIQSV